MPELHINYGINRKAEDKKGVIEHQNGSLTLWGEWGSDGTHETIKRMILAAHPGWNITGYAPAPSEVADG